MARKIGLALALILLSGCAPKPEIAYYGSWTGAFRFSDSGKPVEDLRGYLQLYATSAKFILHFGTARQTFDVSGAWKLKGNQILLRFADFEPAGLSKQQAEEIRFYYLPPDDVKSSLGRSLAFDLNASKDALKSGPLTLAGRPGAFSFSKNPLGTYR